DSVYGLSATVRKLGLHNGYQIMVIENRLATAPPRTLTRLANEMLQAESVPSTVVEWGRSLVVLLGSLAKDVALAAANRLVQAAARQGHQLVIGLSTPRTQTTDMRRSYQEAVDAVRVGAGLSDQGCVWVFVQSGSFWWLEALLSEIHSTNRLCVVIESIASADHEKGTELFRTLESYLDHLVASGSTAQALFIH